MGSHERCFERDDKEDLMKKYKEIKDKIYLTPILVTREEMRFYHQNKEKFD